MPRGRIGGSGGSGVVSDSSLLLLTSLAEGPKHGYALIRDIEHFAGVELGPGTLYGALNRLEEMGLVEKLPEEDRRRPYRITPSGEKVLEAQLRNAARVVATGELRLQLRRA